MATVFVLRIITLLIKQTVLCLRPQGVSWNSACCKWVAVLWDRSLKRARHLGSFESEEEAARAYDREALRLLGGEAGLNFRDSERRQRVVVLLLCGFVRLPVCPASCPVLCRGL